MSPPTDQRSQKQGKKSLRSEFSRRRGFWREQFFLVKIKRLGTGHGQSGEEGGEGGEEGSCSLGNGIPPMFFT